MADIDVKIGLQVTGDASGAQQVDAALRQVKATAQGIDGSAAQGVGQVADEVGNLKTAIDNLSPEKARMLLGGLVQTLAGMGSGNVTQSLSGLARHLQGLATVIPLPGVGIALGIAVSTIVGAWAKMREGAKETERAVNEMGLTVDEEMSRLEAWSQAEMKWDGIAGANEKLREDLGTVKTVAESTMTALEKVFQVGSDARVAKLQRDLSSAQAAGDTGKAGQIQQAIDQEKAFAELVKINNQLAQLEGSYAEMLAKNQQIEENGRKAAEEAATYSQKLDELKAAVERQTGNADAVYDPASRTKLVSDLRDQIAEAERLKQKFAGMDIPRYAATGMFPEASKIADLPRLQGLLSQLENAETTWKSVIMAEKGLAKLREKDNEEAKIRHAELVAAELELDTLKKTRVEMEIEAGPETATRASAQSAQITGAAADILEKSLQMTAENAAQTKQSAEEQAAAAILATKTGEQLRSDMRRVYEQMWATASEGGNIESLVQEGARIYEALDRIGQAASVSNPAEVLESIAVNYPAAVEKLKTSGDALKQEAEKTAQKADVAAAAAPALQDAGDRLDGAGQLLVTVSNRFLETVTSMSGSLDKAVKLAEAANRRAAAAGDAAELALSQIRNAKR